MKSVSMMITLFVLLVCWSLNASYAQTAIDRHLYHTSIDASDFDAETLCTAYNIYHEARDQPYEGKVAVAWVGINRARIARKSICDVVWRTAAFSWTLKSPLPAINERRAWIEAKSLAIKVHSGEIADVTIVSGLGATHYHHKDVTPYWAADGVGKKRIGAHVFMRVAGTF